MSAKANAFGDVRAENDHQYLDASFYECQDYKTLFESTDRFIVVGRRGTGKSALTYQLKKVWFSRKSSVILIAPNEEQVIGLRPVASLFGDSVTRIRAGIKIGWRYALLMEIASQLQADYKAKREVESRLVLSAHLKAWQSKNGTCIDRLRLTLRDPLKAIDQCEDRIAEISTILQLSRIAEDVVSAVGAADKTFVVLVDRLDEGYEPDAIGTGIVDGIIYGTDEIRSLLGSSIKAIVFIRDNIFRAIESEDKDFSRNLESQVLRLHWDHQELFYMVARRARHAFNIQKESDIKTWNAITASELHGREGFKKCLQLTLYRPRDVIALLNTAFYQAQRQEREVLIEADFDASAKQISVTRYSDLGKEYESVFPGVTLMTASFANGPAKLPWRSAMDLIDEAMSTEKLDPAAAQHFKILGKPEEALKALYGIGFIGIYDNQFGSFVFSHDGKRPNKDFLPEDTLMIHPCYWPALNLSHEVLGQEDAEEIFDEYEIKIESQGSEQRKRLLGQIIGELTSIPFGSEGACLFEDWCKRAIEIAFASHLSNVQLRANGAATQRRDVIATNQGSGIWGRILQDYRTRQVVFEVKNYEKIRVNEFRQVHSYLGKEYGSLGFIVCRDSISGLTKGAELDAFREFYAKECVIVKLTAKDLVSILSKLRSPEKKNAGDVLVGKLLDTYIRMYASGQSDVGLAKGRKGRS